MICLMSAVEFVIVNIWCSCESSCLWIRMQKLVLGLSVPQILPEKINKIFCQNNLGFLDVNIIVWTTLHQILVQLNTSTDDYNYFYLLPTKVFGTYFVIIQHWKCQHHVPFHSLIWMRSMRGQAQWWSGNTFVCQLVESSNPENRHGKGFFKP